VHFDLAVHFPDDRTIAIPDLTKASSMHADDSGVINHQGVARRLFTRTADGNFGHSAVSKALVIVLNLQNFVIRASGNMCFCCVGCSGSDEKIVCVTRTRPSSVYSWKSQ
jgi:hypothetical protein